MSLFGIDILLIEDNEGDRRLVVETLKQNQPAAASFLYRITEAETLDQAMQSLSTTDLILLDLSLPDAPGGLATFSEVYRVAKCPVYVLTGLADVNLAIETRLHGAYKYIVKDWIHNNGTQLHFDIQADIHFFRQSDKIVQFQRERLREARSLNRACASCHKWQDHKTGEWLTPERYLELYADIHLSHGVCDVCARKLYPEFMKANSS